MFTFEKTYTMSVKSSGIATKPKAPVLTVTAAKGDSGKISVKHIDSASKSGTIKVKATCKDKTVEVVSYTNSGTIAHNASKTFTKLVLNNNCECIFLYPFEVIFQPIASYKLPLDALALAILFISDLNFIATKNESVSLSKFIPFKIVWSI